MARAFLGKNFTLKIGAFLGENLMHNMGAFSDQNLAHKHNRYTLQSILTWILMMLHFVMKSGV